MAKLHFLQRLDDLAILQGTALWIWGISEQMSVDYPCLVGAFD